MFLKSDGSKSDFDVENLCKSKKLCLSLALSKDGEIIIKKANKGGAIMVWSKNEYIKEAGLTK